MTPADASAAARGARGVRATMRDLVADVASSGRGVTFVDARFAETRRTWSEIHAGATAVADALRARGLRPGTRVLVPMASTPAAITGLLGAFLADVLPLTVSAEARLGQDAAWARRRADALVKRHGIGWSLVADEDGAPPRVQPTGAGGAEPEAREHPAGASDLALIQFTSGTTRQPRGIELTHAAVLANVALAVDEDARGPDAVHVTWLPLHHDMGLVGGLLASLPAAHDLVLMDPACFVLKPVSWLEMLSRHRATSTAAPNFALAVTCERVPEAQVRRRHVDLSALHSLHDGAEPVRPLTVRRFEERFREHGLGSGVVRPVYGLAEATLLVTAPPRGRGLVTRRVDGLEVPGVGRPVGDFEARIAFPGDPAARPLRDGEPGEILLRGASLFRGYHQDPAATREAFAGGWFRTGDLGIVDETGELFVTGRLKDLLIVAGRNVHAHEVGDVVDDLPFARKGHSHAVAVPRAQADAATEEIVVLLSPAVPAARRLRRAADHLALAAEALGPGGSTLGRWARSLGALAATALSPERDPARLERLARELEPEVRRHVQRALGLAVDRVELVARLPKTSSGKVRREDCVAIALRRRRA